MGAVALWGSMLGKRKAYPALGGERGMGQGWYGAIGKLAVAALLIGAVLNEKFAGKAKAFVDAGIEQGVLFLVAGPNVVRFTPALNLTAEEFAEGMSRFTLAVAQVVNG